MKTVAQTVIGADHFYTIAAHTGNVIQAVEGVKGAGTVRLGKNEHKPARHRQRHLAAPVGGCGRHLPDVDGPAHPGRKGAPALFLGRRQVRGYSRHRR